MRAGKLMTFAYHRPRLPVLVPAGDSLNTRLLHLPVHAFLLQGIDSDKGVMFGQLTFCRH